MTATVKGPQRPAPGMASGPADVDYGSLAEFLAALAYPARLELLRILRFPHLVSDIRLSPLRVEPGENPERTASKQTIQAHLDKLVDADLVRVEPAGEGSRGANVYTVNSQKVYAVTEDLRKVSTLYAGRGAVGEVTGTLGAAPGEATRAKGPRLVLVHGLYEGKSFPLDARLAADGQWVIGRRRGIAVSLDYDPYVSLENSVVRRDGERFLLEDVPGSKNGTSVDWEPIPKGRAHALRPAQVIGVGRSLLVFAQD
ncbi:MAG: FHA domain-containing protein [Halobacteriales archaeon]|nr:FHA domain-containing protein [Halobacteriales archaeon]